MKKLLLVVIALGLNVSTLRAHGDDTHSAARQDVKVKTAKVAGNVYILQGRGGNIGALVGSDGILIVDDDYKALSEKLRDALKDLGSGKPKYVLNTHWHGDHTEGNLMFGKDSTIVAHENVRKRLLDPPVIFGQKTPAYPSYALPVVTYAKSMTLYFNGEDVRAVHYPAGHTDGDTVVFFVQSNVVHLGDNFFTGRFPFVDLASGGSVQGLINNLATLITEIPADARLIPGHGPVSTLDDLKTYHRTIIDTAAIVQNAMKKRKSLDDIKKSGLPEKYKEWGSGFIKTDMWIEILYKSYARK